jgi:hypothetical protein
VAAEGETVAVKVRFEPEVREVADAASEVVVAVVVVPDEVVELLEPPQATIRISNISTTRPVTQCVNFNAPLGGSTSSQYVGLTRSPSLWD